MTAPDVSRLRPELYYAASLQISCVLLRSLDIILIPPLIKRSSASLFYTTMATHSPRN